MNGILCHKQNDSPNRNDLSSFLKVVNDVEVERRAGNRKKNRFVINSILSSGYNLDSTSIRPTFYSHSTAIQPRYDQSTIRPTCVWAAAPRPE